MKKEKLKISQLIIKSFIIKSPIENTNTVKGGATDTGDKPIEVPGTQDLKCKSFYDCDHSIFNCGTGYKFC